MILKNLTLKLLEIYTTCEPGNFWCIIIPHHDDNVNFHFKITFVLILIDNNNNILLVIKIPLYSIGRLVYNLHK